MVCFSPYDNVTEFDGTIKQWSYVEKDIKNSFLKYLPFTGNGWYHISLVTWLLDAGVLQMKHILFLWNPLYCYPTIILKNQSKL